MMVSKNFSLLEMIKSPTADRLGIDNTPSNGGITDCLTLVAEKILEPVRAHYGVPIIPSSGYRCLALNRAVGSKDTSQHIMGQAVDFEVPGTPNLSVAKWIRDNMEFDQLILEFYRSGEPNTGWVHCSYRDGRNRKEVLTISNTGTHIGLGE